MAKSTGAVHVAIELMDRGSLGDLKKLLLPKKIEIPESILAAMARDILTIKTLISARTASIYPYLPYQPVAQAQAQQ